MLGIWLMALTGMASTHYVVTNGTPGVTSADPYTNWATAGTSILEVVNAAMTNTEPRIVWVTNGTYYFTNGVSITNALTIQSVNGRSNTIFNGNYPVFSNYCFYINPGSTTSTIDGFTITNFAVTNIVNFGAIYATAIGSGRSKIINCLVTGNRGKHPSGGSDAGGIQINNTDVTNCIIRGNTAQRYGGGISVGDNSIVCDSLIEGNSCGTEFVGGGVYFGGQNSTISNCAVINNIAADGGGICFYSSKSGRTIINCVITGNTAKGYNSTYSGQGGGIGFQLDCSIPPLIQNCTINGNFATNSGGGISGPNFILRNCLFSGNVARTNAGGVLCQTGIVESCTIVSNTAGVSGGGLYFSTVSVTGQNNIVYYNSAGVSANNFTNTTGNTGLNYSCVTPAVDGIRNITNDPALKDLSGGNCRLRMSSPCVNAGTNQNWMTNAVDLEGNARILNGIVDMGAYETILWQGTIYRF